MAITQVTAPLSVPATNADWTNMTYHLKANRLGLNNPPFILTNDDNTSIPAIAIGSYIQFGDSLYIVDTSDYTIQGTPVDGNNYIRIEPSGTTLIATWIQDKSSYDWNPVNNYYEISASDYALLPYLVLKDGTEYAKYSMVLPTRVDGNLFVDTINSFAPILFPTQLLRDSFASPSSNPTGLTFDGTNLISCDSNTDRIYIHDGISSSILSSFPAPSSNPIGLTFDGTNLISCDYDSARIYIHDGISSSILSDFASPSTNPSGLTFDGTNLISCDNSSDLIYIHDGISSSILSSFAAPSTIPRGLAFYGTNLISCDSDSDLIYIHDGVSSSILSSFASPSTTPRGLTFDGTNLISCDNDSARIYIHTSELKFLL